MDADRALLTPRGELVRGCAQLLAERLAGLPLTRRGSTWT